MTIKTRQGTPVTIIAGDVDTGHVDFICHYPDKDTTRHGYMNQLTADGGAVELINEIERVATKPKDF